jgi:hypothetical protein
MSSRRYARAPGQWPYIDDERRIRRVDLSPRDVDDLVAFLETLTDIDGERRPLTPLVRRSVTDERLTSA